MSKHTIRYLPPIAPDVIMVKSGVKRFIIANPDFPASEFDTAEEAAAAAAAIGLKPDEFKIEVP